MITIGSDSGAKTFNAFRLNITRIPEYKSSIAGIAIQRKRGSKGGPVAFSFFVPLLIFLRAPLFSTARSIYHTFFLFFY
jgi:hypothetical protein